MPNNQLDEDDNDFTSQNVVRFESGVMAAKWTSSSRRRLKHLSKLSPTEYYSRSLLADIAAALTSSFFVSIPVSVIDKAIVQSVAGTVPLGQGLKSGFTRVFTNPIASVTHKPFLMVCGVYSITYLTANFFESIIFAKSQNLFEDNFAIEMEQDVGQVQFAKFLSVTMANMSAAVAKDRAFARMFGVSAPSKLPMISWSCWVARDLLTIGCAFSLPKPLAKFLSDPNNGPLLPQKYAGVASQLLPVMMVQVLSTPLHLMANDFYNFKRGEPRVFNARGELVSGGKTPIERLALLKREGPKSFLARLGRIAPAFGFGGIGNASIRDSLRAKMGIKQGE